MGTTSALYRIMLLLHIVATVVGFGGLLAAGMLNAKAFRSPVGQARTLLVSSQAIAKIAYYGFYALLAFGIVLIAISDSAFSFGAPWVSAAFVVWFVMVGVSHGMVRPAVAGLLDRARTLETAAPGDATSVLESDEAAGGLARRLAVGEGLVQLMLIIALVLMIWQPGN